jgi:hypothetical protein
MISNELITTLRAGWPGGGRVSSAFAKPAMVAERQRVARGCRKACMEKRETQRRRGKKRRRKRRDERA